MKKIILTALIGLLLVFSASASSLGKIEMLHIWETHGGLLIAFDKTAEMASNVESTQNLPTGTVRRDYVILPKTHPYFKEMFAMLMSAKMTGTSVRLGYDPQGPTFERFVKIKHIYFY